MKKLITSFSLRLMNMALLLNVTAMPVPILGMNRLKESLREVLYTITPASGNPLTWLGNNFHAVQENLCYRSKTMSSSALEWYIKKYSIKTIINLREASGIWFDKEKMVADRNCVQLHTITLDSKKLPTQDQLKEIFTLFQNTPKPILFHCQAGVDRTSLVAAFWKLVMQNTTLEQALEQLTPFYGHFEWSRPLMRKCIELLDATRDANGQIILDLYNPEQALKAISLSPLPIRAAKSMAITAKKSPFATAGIVAFIASAAGLSFYYFRK